MTYLQLNSLYQLNEELNELKIIQSIKYNLLNQVKNLAKEFGFNTEEMLKKLEENLNEL